MLAQVASVHQQISDLGASVIAVGPSAPYQAAHLEKSLPYPLLLDPERRLFGKVGIGTQSLAVYVFNVRAWLRWLWAFATNRRQGKITGHYSNLPGVAIVLPDGTVSYAYRGRGLGDYPPISEILEAL